MGQSSKEDLLGSFPVDNFTEFFFSLDDETLAEIAYQYPQALTNMCIALTLDQQLLREEVAAEKKKKKLQSWLKVRIFRLWKQRLYFQK